MTQIVSGAFFFFVFFLPTHSVGWFLAYYICVYEFLSSIDTESIQAQFGWVVSLVCPSWVPLRMFEIALGNFVSSRGKNFKVGNFFSRVASQINYITKKNNGPLFNLEKSTQEGKNNGGRVGNGMGGEGGGAKGKSHQSQGKCVKKKTESS